MGLFDKLFGGKKAEPITVDPPAEAPPATIRVYDKYGRQIEISRKDWLESVFLPALKKEQGNPEALYQHIVCGLDDGFASEMLPYAKQLEKTDSDPVRGAVLHGVTLLELKRFSEARDVMEAARKSFGEHGYLETNLAKAYAGLDQHERAESVLWHALELDPNQDNALGWYAAIQRGKYGESGSNAAFAKAAQIRGSWRPQLWLARAALGENNADAAQKLYEVALAHFADVPTDVLMQISGDLGNAGQLQLLITVCAPRFAVQIHGLQVGNNLIKAYLDSGQTQEARKLLELLYSQQRPDWQEHLVFWEQEIDKVDDRYGPVADSLSLEMHLLTLPEPVWMRSRLNFETLLPPRPLTSPHILVLCGSGVKEQEGEKVLRSQPADDLGRVTRGLPLLIAEELLLRTTSRVTYVLPWIKDGGFVLSVRPWDTGEKLFGELDAAWILATHIDACQEPWKVQMRVADGKSGETLKEWTFAVPHQKNPSDAIARCVNTILHYVGMPREEGPFTRPPTPWLAQYLVTLEQGLSVCVAELVEGERRFLHSERSIFDNMLHMAVELPTNVRVRMLLLSSLERQSRLRPGVVAEYREKLLLLEKQHPISDQRVAEAISRAVRGLTEEQAVH